MVRWWFMAAFKQKLIGWRWTPPTHPLCPGSFCFFCVGCVVVSFAHHHHHHRTVCCVVGWVMISWFFLCAFVVSFMVCALRARAGLRSFVFAVRWLLVGCAHFPCRVFLAARFCVHYWFGSGSFLRRIFLLLFAFARARL